MKTLTRPVNYFLSAFLLLTLFLGNSCKKDKLIEDPFPNADDYSSIQDFFLKNGKAIQTFTIDPTVQNSITANQGTSFMLNANSLLDGASQLPSGNITVQIKEIYNIKDMVLSNKPTTSLGLLLHSGGEVFIRFLANGIEYFPSAGLDITMPYTGNGPLVPGAGFFTGNEDSTGAVDWMQDTTVLAQPDSFGNYLYSLPNLYYNWINCDEFYNAGSLTNISVTTQVSGTNGEAVTSFVFLLFKSINSVMGIYAPTLPNLYSAANIPVGIQATAITIGVGKATKKLYFGKIAITVSATQSVTVSVTPTTTDQIKLELQNL